jgi:redox-sensitive bicupin YhaK (pirin superfamily)
VKTLSPTLYIDFQLAPGATLVLPAAAPERALYGVDNGFVLDGTSVPATTMIPIPAGATPTLTAPDGARLVMIGGEPLGHRFMSWNFVSSRKERIQQAAEEWQAQTFPKVPGETEFIPLPPKRP